MLRRRYALSSSRRGELSRMLLVAHIKVIVISVGRCGAHRYPGELRTRSTLYYHPHHPHHHYHAPHTHHLTCTTTTRTHPPDPQRLDDVEPGDA